MPRQQCREVFVPAADAYPGNRLYLPVQIRHVSFSFEAPSGVAYQQVEFEKRCVRLHDTIFWYWTPAASNWAELHQPQQDEGIPF